MSSYQMKNSSRGKPIFLIISVFNKCRDIILVGFGIGIPTLSNQETKYARYVLNKIAIQKMFEGEMDDWDEDEEFND